MKAITPDQVIPLQENEKLKHARSIPTFVIEAVNNLIVKNYIPELKACKITTEEVVKESIRLHPVIDRSTIFENNWLDFEPVFEEAGWKVIFHKLPYYDSNPDYFTFELK